jgi:hypothetical protein
MTTLTDIRTKVRRLTGRASTQQITDDQIDEYVNTFYLYDMPASLKLFSEETTFVFMTEANVDQYNLETMQISTPSGSVNAVDYYLDLKPPVYVASYECTWSQDRQQFFNAYPYYSEIQTSATGDGTSGPYTFTFNSTPILQYSVTAGAIDDTDSAANAVDVPTNRTDGTWELVNTNTAVTGSVDYIAGTGTITFANTIPSGNQITFTARPYQASRPQSFLFYDNILTLRPVPDASYLVTINAYKRPVQLLNSADNPELKQWWQYIAYGAAKKVFEDTQDPEGVSTIMAAFKEQERMVLRRTIVQRTNQRTATIYNSQNTIQPFGVWGGNY